jgi:4-amino-4-deoxy-L-arabinose transferase-like glycosyltransferase
MAGHKQKLLLALACVACLLPFINKAFYIDDPLFLWCAKHIQAHPGDPFGFDVSWEVGLRPMVKETKNPPLACYYLALAGTLLGWSERALHLAFLVPAVATVWGTFRLAQRLCSRPALAALIALATPVFLVSSSTIMCDTMMLAFWVWALVFWEEGITGKRMELLSLAGLFIGFGILTKYFAICLVPLLLIYSLLREKKLGAWIFPLLLPVGMVAAYLIFIDWRYDVNLVREVTGFAWVSHERFEKALGMNLTAKLIVSLTFIGGCLAPVLFFAPVLWRWRVVASFIIVPLILGWILHQLGMTARYVEIVGDRALMAFFEGAVWVASALLLCALAAADFWKYRDAHSALLCLWLGGTLCFTGFVNWIINARSILPMAPAAGILIARRIDDLVGRDSVKSLPWHFIFPLVPSFLLGIWVTWSDYQAAGSARTAAQVVRAYAGKHPGQHIWFCAHWGFQYYMEEYGFRILGQDKVDCKEGDIVVVSRTSFRPNVPSPKYTFVTTLGISPSETGGVWTYRLQPGLGPDNHVLLIPITAWLSTNQMWMGAGFYSHIIGPLPFVVGNVPDERYQFLQLVAPWKAKKQ